METLQHPWSLNKDKHLDITDAQLLEDVSRSESVETLLGPPVEAAACSWGAPRVQTAGL